MYYVNEQTGETLWEPPLDNSPYIPYVPPTPAEMKKLEMSRYFLFPLAAGLFNVGYKSCTNIPGLSLCFCTGIWNK